MEDFALDTALIRQILRRGNSVEIRTGKDGVVVLELMKKARQRLPHADAT